MSDARILTENTERDRSSLFSTMLQALTGVAQDAGVQGFLEAMCQGFLNNNDKLQWVWYGFQNKGRPLIPTQEFGLVLHPSIPESTLDPCHRAFDSETPILCLTNDPHCPDWLLPLRDTLAELLIVPFGIEGQKAIGVLGSSEAGYFERIGTEYFSAFAYMGDMIMTLQAQARHDPLTGLLSRMALDERMERAIEHAHQQQRLLAVIMMDFDDFKDLNEQYGRLAGDQVLVEFTQRLRQKLQTKDDLIRMGSDEFVLLVEDLERWSDLETVMEGIQIVLDRAFVITEIEIRIPVSIGVTVYPLDDEKSRELLHHADLALHQAKTHKGRHQEFYVLYDPSSIYDPNTPKQIARREHFRRLLENHVVTMYQPILHVPTGRIHEVEALARLEDNHVLLGTSEFLPWLSAEDRRKLSCKVLEQAAHQWRLWQDQGLSVAIGVNFEPQDLLLEEVLQHIENTLQRFQVPPASLMIEVLEGDEFLDYASAKIQLTRLKSLGVRIALDDLGTAYASLLRLKDYPFDAVKLDQAFSRGIEKLPRDLHFLSSMLEMANGLGVELIVEGIESSEVLAAVIALGIRQVQGYVISRPITAAAVTEYLRTPPVFEQHPADSLLVSFAKFLILAKGLRTVLATMPQSINLALVCDNERCPLYPVLTTVPGMDAQRAALQAVVAQLVQGEDSSALSLLEVYDHLTAGILNDMAAQINN